MSVIVVACLTQWPGLTKDLSFRRQQLSNLNKLLQEREKELVQAVKNDLHKHEVEILTGEIGPVAGEIEFMLKVKSYFEEILMDGSVFWYLIIEFGIVGQVEKFKSTI